eukprot:CAMPEP_0174963294 /NCGR_PEP_ID=MMETSP0004_2-20121128/5251_1 /TAXON_ID=420556 /ORGANISM="Ochromonas sp., Strain CCMP1393" /LENGTH=59 /DNA_ID=CAMNT_0016211905 /DNA_START=130 /DNA_END=309 /DNA_ORIENTATION=-
MSSNDNVLLSVIQVQQGTPQIPVLPGSSADDEGESIKVQEPEEFGGLPFKTIHANLSVM